jgi:hypothetical protein
MIICRKEEYGGDCAICGQPVELLRNGEPWHEKCRCGEVESPVWSQIDGYSKTHYRKRFEIRIVPATETEG